MQHTGGRHDLAIIGSGGAGFAAAIAARRRGRSVVMVESGVVGGTCVNTGCVPSKALLAAAEARRVAADRRFPGIHTEAGPVEMAALVGGTDALVETMRADKYVDLAAAYGWEIVTGTARFVDGPALVVESVGGGTRRIEAAHYLIATGSAPAAPPIAGLDQAGYLTSTTAMQLDELPASLLVVGGNYVGLELGQMFARLGTDVTVVEALDRLAPAEEPEVGAAIAQVFADEGIGVRTVATVSAVRRDGAQIVARLHTGAGRAEELRAERVLVATGRRPVTADLDLRAVGVQTGPKGEVAVDAHLRTDNPRIWAAGDVTGAPQFVYVAAAHGAVAADNALAGTTRTLDYTHLPRVTFTTPTIAAVGLTHAQATAQGLACTCRVLPLAYVPRALVTRDTRGLVKLVAETGTGRLIGASMLAEGAGDAIQAAVYAVTKGMTVEEMADVWAPYLTMAEALKLAAQTFTRDVAMLSCCAS